MSRNVAVVSSCLIQVVDTHDASNPVVENSGYPLLTCDVSDSSIRPDYVRLGSEVDGKACLPFQAEKVTVPTPT